MGYQQHEAMLFTQCGQTIGTHEYSGTSITQTPINQTLDYPNTKTTAQLGYFVKKCMFY